MKKNITIGEKYKPAMEIKSQEDADKYFEKCVKHSMKYFGKTREEAEILERINIGYFAGYYDRETRRRVYSLFKTNHPIIPEFM